MAYYQFKHNYKGRAAVYKMFGDRNRPLYVGCSINPLARLHFHAENRAFPARCFRVEIKWYQSLDSALKAETRAIKKLLPKYNVNGK